MKIERVDLIHIRMPLVSPFETSMGRHEDLEKLILKAYTPDGTAYSECVASAKPFYGQETIGTARHILRDFILPTILGRDIAGPEEYQKMISPFRGHAMAKAVVENALWVLKAEEEGSSLAALIGGAKDGIQSGVSIGIQRTPEELLDQIAGYLEAGYPRIKIKIKPGKDLDLLEAVRLRYPHIPLMVDANAAYTLRDMAPLKAMDEFGLQMIEQPLSHEDLLDHAKLQARLKTPLSLDESINGPHSARAAAELGACRIINIKQGRVGGILPAMEVHDIAWEHGMGVWCGGMLETGIGRAVNVALATLPNFIYPSDISASERYWERDIIDPEFRINGDGTIDVPKGPGLGVAVNESFLARVTLGRETVTA